MSQIFKLDSTPNTTGTTKPILGPLSRARGQKNILCKTFMLSILVNHDDYKLWTSDTPIQDYETHMTIYCNSTDAERDGMEDCTYFKKFFDYFDYANAMECDPFEDILAQKDQGKLSNMNLSISFLFNKIHFGIHRIPY